MDSVICTLFENHYSFGVGALVNSLYKYGFKGDIYAGYRGEMPKWAEKAENNQLLIEWNIKTLFVGENIRLHFVPLSTNYHFANYKPNFMQLLFEGPAKNADAIFYFDPDIVLSYNWRFFEEWVEYGITVCEDVNSPLPLKHPRRMAWHKYFTEKNINLSFTQENYANSGFVGVSKKDKEFLPLWIKIHQRIAEIIGGFERTSIPGMSHLNQEQQGYYFPFNIPDQDAFNVTIGAWDDVISFVGKEGMAFKHGSILMTHALGRDKPWKANYLLRILNGNRPRSVDKQYWKAVSAPIKVYPGSYIFWKKFIVNITAFVGRFYGRS